MRTKTLVLTAAFVAAGAATSMAQVYSQNVVGYVNASVAKATSKPTTYAILANPLNGTNNNINTILPSVADGTQVFLFTPGVGFTTIETFISGLGWDPGTSTLAPGDGFFIAFDNASAVANPQVVTFVGEVPQGTLVNPIPNGYSIQSSIVPQAGGLQTVLQFDPPENTQVFKWNVTAQTYTDIFTYFGGGAWDPAEPTVGVAEGFFVLNPATAANWTRTFTVQ